MTNQQIRYVGIDIAAKSFDSAFPKGAKDFYTTSFSNNLSGWQKLDESLNYESDICVIEATGAYHLGLAMFLNKRGKKVCVVNPLSVKHFSRMKMLRAKTDKTDSCLLSQYGKLMKPNLWCPREEQVTDLQQLMTLSEQLIKQRTALKNQLKSFLLVPNFNKLSIKILEEQIDSLTKKIEQANSQVQQIIERHYQELSKCLLSIPGIGPKTTASLILVTEGFTKFETYKALIAYTGLAPRTFESGTSVKGASHICKLGAKQLRKLLYECAHSAKRFNPICKKLFDRLYHEKKKPFKVAMIAVANKLIKIAFALAKSLAVFDPNYQIAK